MDITINSNTITLSAGNSGYNTNRVLIARIGFNSSIPNECCSGNSNTFITCTLNGVNNLIQDYDWDWNGTGAEFITLDTEVDITTNPDSLLLYMTIDSSTLALLNDGYTPTGSFQYIVEVGDLPCSRLVQYDFNINFTSSCTLTLAP